VLDTVKQNNNNKIIPVFHSGAWNQSSIPDQLLA